MLVRCPAASRGGVATGARRDPPPWQARGAPEARQRATPRSVRRPRKRCRDRFARRGIRRRRGNPRRPSPSEGIRLTSTGRSHAPAASRRLRKVETRRREASEDRTSVGGARRRPCEAGGPGGSLELRRLGVSASARLGTRRTFDASSCREGRRSLPRHGAPEGTQAVEQAKERWDRGTGGASAACRRGRSLPVWESSAALRLRSSRPGSDSSLGRTSCQGGPRPRDTAGSDATEQALAAGFKVEAGFGPIEERREVAPALASREPQRGRSAARSLA